MDPRPGRAWASQSAPHPPRGSLGSEGRSCCISTPAEPVLPAPPPPTRSLCTHAQPAHEESAFGSLCLAAHPAWRRPLQDADHTRHTQVPLVPASPPGGHHRWSTDTAAPASCLRTVLSPWSVPASMHRAGQKCGALRAPQDKLKQRERGVVNKHSLLKVCEVSSTQGPPRDGAPPARERGCVCRASPSTRLPSVPHSCTEPPLRGSQCLASCSAMMIIFPL